LRLVLLGRDEADGGLVEALGGLVGFDISGVQPSTEFRIEIGET
jgi:hypothetical protein